MPSSEIRKDAREALIGKWGKGVCILLAYLLISFAEGFIQGIFENICGKQSALVSLISLAFTIINTPIAFGLVICFIKLKRGEDVSAFDFLNDGFSRFGRAWGIALNTFVKLLIPILCLVALVVLLIIAFAVPFLNSGSTLGIIFLVAIAVLYIASIVYIVSRSLLYVLAYMIGYDEPELSSKACVEKSAELMKGNRGNYFLLELSFIGWAILSVLTLGIGYLWLAPYMSVASVCFYDRIIGRKAETSEEDSNKIEE